MNFYNIHNIIRIKSEPVLFELEYFRVDEVDDIDLYVNTSPTHYKIYREIGVDLSVKEGNCIQLATGKLLKHSPHVLYVNVVEPLLRLMAVTKSNVLLHSACLEKDEQGFLISAPPDTGKTTCTLRLLEKGFSLLSDDMTLISDKGTCYSFPKPFTISAHTLKTLEHNPNIGFKLRSLVHSKTGRKILRALGEIPRFPILSLNALAQAVIKPPKIYPENLAQIEIKDKTEARRLYFLDKLSEGIKELPRLKALNLLMQSTKEAYETPPYERIFPRLKLKNQSYPCLMRREEQIVQGLLKRLEIKRLGSKQRLWHEQILGDS